MGELMTKHMWDQRHKEVTADTKKYVVQFVGRYKAAYSYCVLKKLRKNLTAKNEQKPLLEQRRWQNYNRPLHCGSVYILHGPDQKKWRRRYCVLQPDYTLEVYDSQEDFETANRPRYSRKHSSYEVVENIDIHMNQIVKAYMRDFGFVCDNVSSIVKRVITTVDSSKRPTQHALALYHPYRGSFYIAADSAVEKDQWLKSLQDAKRQLCRIHCEDETQREAFAFAIKEACAAEEHCNVSVKMYGTQEEIVADFITDYLSNGCKTMLQTKVKGDMYKKFKMWESISSFLSLSVQKIVDNDYPSLRAKAEADVEETKPKMLSSMPEINSIYETATAEIIAGLEASFQEEMVTQVLPKIPDMVTRMGESMMTPLREVKDVFVSLSESVKRQVSSTSTEFANNVDCFFLSNLDAAPRNPEVMHTTFQAAMGKKSAFTVLAETFPKAQYFEQEAKFCVLLQKILDSAICTFEVLCGDYVLKNGGHLPGAAVAKIEARVLKKLSHDNAIFIRQFLTEATEDILFQMLRGLIYYDSRNKLRNYEDFIPSAYAHFMPVSNVFRDAVYEKLEDDLRPPITAAFKRLTHDRYSMIRYHSSSTINSHSSTASDELPSSVKHESSVSRTSSVRTSPGQESAAVHAVGSAMAAEALDQGNAVGNAEDKPTNDDDGSEDSPHTCLPGFVQDGETGECLEKVDENGELIRDEASKEEQKDDVANVDDVSTSKIPDKTLASEGSETNADHEQGGDPTFCPSGLQDVSPGKELSVATNEPPENDISETQHLAGDADPKEVVMSSFNRDAQEVQQEWKPEIQNPTEDDLQPDSVVITDPEYGEQAHSVQLDQGEDLSEHKPAELEKPETSEPRQGRDDVYNLKEPPACIGQEESLKEEQKNTEGKEVSQENVPVRIEQPEPAPEEDLSKTQDVVSDEYPVQVMSNSHPEPEKNSHSEEDSVIPAKEESLEDANSQAQTEQRSVDNSEVEVTSFSKQEVFKDEGHPETHSNGGLKQNGHSEPVQGEEVPVAPTRKKKRSSSKNKGIAKVENESNPSQNQVLEADLDKYNGVVEQIIHTGEEKLI